MTDPRKVTDLSALTTPAAADLFHLVDDVAGTPTSKKVVVSDLFEINVQHYGAKGDGFAASAGANTTAIQAALTTGSGSRDVIIPDTGNDYFVNATLPVASNTRIRGSGSVKLADSSDVDVFTLANGATNVIIDGIRIDGNGANQSTTVRLISGNGATNVWIQRCRLTESRDDAIRFNFTATTNKNIHIFDNDLDDIGAYGTFIEQVETCYVTNNRFTNWGKVIAARDAIVFGFLNKRVYIDDNTGVCDSGTLFGIEVAGAPSVIDGGSVSNNIFDAVTAAKAFIGISGKFNNCDITNNKILKGVATTRSGLEIIGNHNNVSDNNIQNGSIAIGNTDNFTTTWINFSDNIVRNEGTSQDCLRINQNGSQTGVKTISDIIVDGNLFDMVDATTPLSGIFLGAPAGDISILERITISSSNRFRGPGAGIGNGIRFNAAAGSKEIDIKVNVIRDFGSGVFIPATSNHTDVTVEGNDLRGNTTGVSNSSTGGTYKIRRNQGFVTENSSTGSIASGGTTDVITHGLDVTPTAADIRVTLKENPDNTPGAIWVDTITSTQFTVNCENDPGASNLDFAWQAIVL